ncbi:MAG TPA: hypothetical protein VET26_05600, partial [Candidatus Sulfotelmatobacter sp.]|nr:hypothetical protein [Candidatus Sulfotelmatobacter sp.]
YGHLDDLAMLGLAAWLFLRQAGAAWTRAFVLAVVLTVEGEPIWGPFPVLVSELASLVLITITAIRPASRATDGDGSPEPGHAQPLLSAPPP